MTRTCDEKRSTGDWLKQVRVGEMRQAGGLQIFGLFLEQQPGPDYLTLDEATAGGRFEVVEINESGSVPTLKVVNPNDMAVFLMAGEHLVGGKQNRVLNASLLVPANTTLPIPVSCVERGRWGYRGATFSGSGTSSHSTLRRMMHSSCTDSYRRSGKAGSDQTQVWREVDRRLTESGSISDTQHLAQAYDDTELVLRPMAEQLPVPEGACGAAFAFGGRIIGLDLFDRPRTLALLWPKLVRAYGIDAHYAAAEGEVQREQVERWLSEVAPTSEEVFRSAGAGEDARLDAPTLLAACLRVEDRLVHLEAFAQGN